MAIASALVAIPAMSASGATSGTYSDEVGGTGVAARTATTALRTTWESDVTAAGGTPGAPIVLNTAGTISGAFHTATDGTTVSVSRTQYTGGPAPVYVGVSPNQGTASCVANGATAGAGMQGGSPRPTALVGGSAACPNGFSYSEVGGAGEGTTRDAVEFTFSRPVLAFGAWFGDLETRTDGLGVAALLRLYDTSGTLLSEQPIEPGPSYLPQSDCSSAATGCGNNTTRWVGYVSDPAQAVSRMVVIVGDEDAAGTALTEGIGFIGPSLDLSQASIHLDKFANAPTDTNGDLLIGAGDTVSYSFVVTNTGTVPVSAISISDPTATGLSCPVGSITAGNTTTCTGTHVLTPAEVDAGSISNTATATGTAYSGTIQSAPASTTTAIPAAGALTITNDVDLASFAATGTVLTYTISVTNVGNVTLSGLGVSDLAPGAGAFDATDCAAIATTLAPNASQTCTVTYQTTQADLDTGGVTNTATVVATTPGGAAVGSADDSASSAAVQTATLALNKTVDRVTAASGDLLTYTLTAINPGNVTLTGLTIVDPAPGAGTFDFSTCAALDGSSLAPNHQVSCTATYRITLADAGSVTNTAHASASGPVAVRSTATSATTAIARPTVIAGLASTGAVLGMAPVAAAVAILLGFIIRRRRRRGIHPARD